MRFRLFNSRIVRPEEPPGFSGLFFCDERVRNFFAGKVIGNCGTLQSPKGKSTDSKERSRRRGGFESRGVPTKV